MTRILLTTVALGFGIALVVPQITSAQNEAGTAKKTDYRGPLPWYFGKLGADEAQKEKFYAIDEEYAGKIEQLQKQIDALKSERDGRMETLLTPGQKLRLQELREAAAKEDAAQKAAEATAAESN